MVKEKKGKYSRELEQLKMLKSINSMLKSSDMENALLANSAKDSETMPDSMVDDMLGRIMSERERNRDIIDINRLTAQAATAQSRRAKSSNRPRRKAVVHKRKAQHTTRSAARKHKKRR